MPRSRDVERVLEAWRAAERAVDEAAGATEREAAEAEARRLRAQYLQLVDAAAGVGQEQDVGAHRNHDPRPQ